MSDFKTKMHLIQIRLGLSPWPSWRSLQCSPDPLAGFEGVVLLREGSGGEGTEGWGEDRRERGKGKGRMGMAWTIPRFQLATSLCINIIINASKITLYWHLQQ